MIHHYYILIYNLFHVTPLLFVFLLLLGLTAIFCILIISIYSYLDLLYRPNNSKYPYNIILDRIMPIIAIISPSIIVFAINPKTLTLLEKFSYIILLHVFVLIPMMYYWANLRSWVSDGIYMMTWKHPKLYFNISLGILYPMIWGVYFSSLRYLRLNNNTEIVNMQSIVDFILLPENLAYLFIFIVSLRNIFWYFVIIIGYIINTRKNLWEITSSLIYSIHLQLLQYYIYFSIVEKIDKIYFIYSSVIKLGSTFNYDYRIHGADNVTGKFNLESFSWFRRVLFKMFAEPVFFYLFVISVVIVDFMLFKEMSHIYYFLFIFPVFLNIYRIFSSVGNTNLINDVCLVDYMNQNLDDVRYPEMFLSCAKYPQYFFGIVKEISEEDLPIWEKTLEKFEKKNKIYSISLKKRLYNKINMKYPRTINNSYLWIKMAYYETTGIRFDKKFKKPCQE